jgi:hypothetical protein
MKKYFRYIYALIAFCILSCLNTTGPDRSPDAPKKYAVYGEFRSWQGNASLQLNYPGVTSAGATNPDLIFPISGTPLDGANVVFCDSTTHTEVHGTFAGSGTYAGYLSINPGDVVYVKVSNHGNPSLSEYFSENCKVPDSFCTITSPVSGATVSSPFDITWIVNAENYTANAVMVEISSPGNTSVVYRKALSIADTSLMVNKSMMVSYFDGAYEIRIIPYIQLNFTNNPTHPYTEENFDYYSRVLVYSTHDPSNCMFYLASQE